MKLPHVKEPCKDCPFRKDVMESWLGEKRMCEIIESDSFVCHKKTDFQCAGHMVSSFIDNQFVDLAGVFGIKLNLKGYDLVFENEIDCVQHHSFK